MARIINNEIWDSSANRVGKFDGNTFKMLGRSKPKYFSYGTNSWEFEFDVLRLIHDRGVNLVEMPLLGRKGGKKYFRIDLALNKGYVPGHDKIKRIFISDKYMANTPEECFGYQQLTLNDFM